MNDNKLFEMIKELCIANGKAIDRIAKEFNISQDSVAKLFLNTMQNILKKMEV